MKKRAKTFFSSFPSPWKAETIQNSISDFTEAKFLFVSEFFSAPNQTQTNEEIIDNWKN
jgi:hypothetical protein